MDGDVLQSRGVHPRDARPAFVADHAVQLGAKAMLLPALGERAYGMVYSLTRREVQALYANLQEYEERSLTAHFKSGTTAAVASMIHRSPPVSAPVDPEYATQWSEIVRRLHLPFEP